ncbi:MAG: Phospho-2-dehydro-3-deoxyheptonate aldolase [Phycisphaerae bacterium]|nr:Phospho-2-dehydro-3-deoxyheptonate aldolase [Phycisphaerae bacterium]
MIVVMKSGSDDATIQHVIDRIGELGLQPHVSRGRFRTIIGAIGEEAESFLPKLKSLPGVDDVLAIMRPYKLAAREFHPEGSVVRVGPVEFGGRACVGIAGPCAVENDTTIFQVGRAVRAAGARMLRGGAFKPRTSPYSFQGMGEDGLKILRAAADELGMPVASEVMDPRQVELAVRYVDMLQIGARNMQNFTLLSEVGKTRKPVLLKRGLAASVKEWLMSAEYVLAQGNKDVVLCERGIKTFEGAMRYTFDVGAVVVAKRETHLPVIIDPSHAAGDRQWVPGLTLAGIAAGADGFIVEVHDCPEDAMCDGPQAVFPAAFAEMMDQCRAVAAAVGREFPEAE